jgi:uncharacterized iron-regulated protein
MRTLRMLCAVAVAALLAGGCATSRKAEGGPGADLLYPLKETPKAEDIYHVPTGLKVNVNDAMEMISDARLIGVGETHDNYNAQRVELLVIRDMYNRYPGKIAIGMEMFREPQQPMLDKWVRGEYPNEMEFLRAVKWYDTWGYDFAYYRDILNFAREKGIDVVALNPPKELQDEVSRSGIDNLAPALKAKLPALGEPDPFQRAVLQSIYEGHMASGGRLDAFIRTQMLWEETMAERVVSYLKSPRGEGKRMVTITGGWHVKYGFGLPKKAVRRMAMPYRIVLPEELPSAESMVESRLMNVDLPAVPLPPSDLVWFVPFNTHEGQRMRMGVQIGENRQHEVVVEAVTPGSPAEKAGVQKGDRIFSFDGQMVKETFDIYYRVGEKKEGEKAAVVVRRDGNERALEVVFHKMSMPPKHPKKD